jgi:predicted nucleic acid-binding protein
VIVLDTSVLIDALSGARRSADDLRTALEAGRRILLPALVLYEWLRGPRIDAELTAQEALFPTESALAFAAEEAAAAASIYRSVDDARGREIDIAIAAHAKVRAAEVWTLNVADFADLPGVGLYRP